MKATEKYYYDRESRYAHRAAFTVVRVLRSIGKGTHFSKLFVEQRTLVLLYISSWKDLPKIRAPELLQTIFIYVM